MGLGQPAYLEARVNIAIPAADIVDVTWALTGKPAGFEGGVVRQPAGSRTCPMFEPSDGLAARVAGRKLLRPDVVGLYTVRPP